MPDIDLGPPENTTTFVLAHYRWPANYRYTEQMSGILCHSRTVEWPEDMPLPDPRPDRLNVPRKPGDRVAMMFTDSKEMRERLWREGWEDVSEDWHALASDTPPVGEVPSPGTTGAPPTGGEDDAAAEVDVDVVAAGKGTTTRKTRRRKKKAS